MTVIIALVLGALAVWLTRKALGAPVYPSVVSGGGHSESRDVDIEKVDESTQITKATQIDGNLTVSGATSTINTVIVPPTPTVVEAPEPKVTKAKKTTKKPAKITTNKPAKKQTKVTKRK